jgi:large subunit ribosomal protein L28
VEKLARRCEICGKTITFGIQFSHSHIRTKRTWTPNLQRVKAIVDGRPKRIKVCTRCLKAGKVTRAI